jgi:hypothetical protein
MKAKYNYNSGSIDDAIKDYEYAFSIESPFGVDLYRMAKCQCLNNNNKETLKYLRLTGQKYTLDPNIYLSRDSIVFTNCLSGTQFRDIKNEMVLDYVKHKSEVMNSEYYKNLIDTTKLFYRRRPEV